MRYRNRGTSRPPPVFELMFNYVLSKYLQGETIALRPALRLRMRDYLQSILLAEAILPSQVPVAMLVKHFSDLAKVTERGPILYKKRGSLSLLFDLFAVQSEMAIDAPDELVLGYTQTMMGFLLFYPDPKSIGMVGLGGGSLVKYCYRHLQECVIAVAEIDPRVINMRENFFIPANDKRLHVFCQDGADFVRDAEALFDVLLIDGFNRNGQPEQLSSQRFYDNCFEALSESGILVVNLLSDAGSADIYIMRLNKAFNGRVLIVDALDSSNKIVFACKGNRLNIRENILAERRRELLSTHGPVFTIAAQEVGRAHHLKLMRERARENK